MMNFATKDGGNLKYDQTLHKSKEKHKTDYGKWYGINMYIMFFFSFAIIGWVWEVVLHFVQTGDIVNRGVLLGPWLPIYGTGGIAVMLFLRKLFDKPILTFFLIMIVASGIEYFTSWMLEMQNGIRWWDYTGYFMNLNGRICLEGAVIFGIGGSLVVYIVAPALSRVYEKISFGVRSVVCTVLLIIFLTDIIHSQEHPNTGKGITVYNVESLQHQYEI